VFLYLVSLTALAGLLYSVYGQRAVDSLAVGGISPQTYIAASAITVTDLLATDIARDSAAADVGTVYSNDVVRQQAILGRLLSAGLPENVLNYLLLRYSDPAGLDEEEVSGAVEAAVALAPTERQREVRLLLERRLDATSVPNQELTNAARSAVEGLVPEVQQRLEAGAVIVREGERITGNHLRALEIAGLYSAQTAAFNRAAWIVVGCLLLAALLALPVMILAGRLRPHLTFNQFTFLVGLTLLVLAVQRIALLLDPSFLFVSLVAILVTVLVSETAGLGWAVWLAVVAALLTPSMLLTTLMVVLVGGVVATLMLRLLRSRLTLLFAATIGGLGSAAVLVTLTLLQGPPPLSTLAAAGLTVAGGILAGISSLGLLPLAEGVFGFLTAFRLLELSSPTTPLLQKLLLEAPGTYQHSLIISNLVEQAVTNIGGNALLARVGALYHDVGKLKRPHFFAENQFSQDNPHTTLSPHLSYLIITSHVRDAIDFLREYRVPRELEAFAAEHHGTTVLTYFYKRALEESAALEDLNFRYPGPRPQSKETAVLMLADAVESASRTLSEPTPNKIRALIDSLIDQRLQDDQLAESPLNFRDLEVIANTFERMLTAILHRRISYPSPEEIQGLRRGGDTRRNESVRAS
jgi:putative nucleotidyltransferase with HDIG domain